MEMNVLKLVLKKNTFESIVDEHVDTLRFETSGFYMSKFTTNKHNTVDDLKNDATLFKSFDFVEFSCVGQKLEFAVSSIVLTDGENPEFELKFVNDTINDFDNEDSGVDIETREDADINNEWIETVPEVDREVGVVPDVATDTSVEIPVETPVTKKEKKNDILAEILNVMGKNDNVYLINNRSLKIGYMGKICGCDRVLNSAKNEHTYDFALSEHTFDIDKELQNKLVELVHSGYVFINPNESKVEDKKLTLVFTVLKVLDVLSLM